MLRGIDTATAKLLRRCLGAVVIYDKYLQWSSICDFFSNQGVQPLKAVPDFHRGFLHGLSDECEWQQSLHGLQAVLGLLLLLGWGRQRCCFCLWGIYVSERFRAGKVATGGDGLLGVCLLWASLMFPEDQPFATALATLGMRIQIVLMYTTAVAHKLVERGQGSMRWLAGDAFRQSLSCPPYAVDLGVWIANNIPHEWGKWITWLTMAIQLISPWALLLVSPGGKASAVVRDAALFALAGLHVAMQLTLDLCIFPVACIVALIVFLPPRESRKPRSGGATLGNDTEACIVLCFAACVLTAVTILATIEQGRGMGRELYAQSPELLHPLRHLAPSSHVGSVALGLTQRLWIPTLWSMFVGTAACTWHIVPAHIKLPGGGEKLVDLHRYMHRPATVSTASESEVDLAAHAPGSMGKTPLWQNLNLQLHDYHHAYHNAQDPTLPKRKEFLEIRDLTAELLARYYCDRHRDVLHNLSISILDYAVRAPPGLLPLSESTEVGWYRCSEVAAKEKPNEVWMY